MTMWQRLLERFVPLMDSDASWLDRRDGVGASTGPLTAQPGNGPSPRGDHAAYEGGASTLSS